MRIVVVDEEVDARSSLLRILRAITHDAQGYDNLCHAVRAMMREHCHVLLLDPHQPDLPCETALSLARQVAPGVSVILTTTDPHGPQVARWVRAGVFRVVGKPFDPAEVLGAVDAARMARGQAPTSGPHPPYSSI